MTELELYKFVIQNNLEYDYVSADEIVLTMPSHLLGSFVKLLGEDYFDDGCAEAHICSDYIYINIVNACNYYGIDCEHIFIKGKNFLSEE